MTMQGEPIKVHAGRQLSRPTRPAEPAAGDPHRGPHQRRHRAANRRAGRRAQYEGHGAGHPRKRRVTRRFLAIQVPDRQAFAVRLISRSVGCSTGRPLFLLVRSGRAASGRPTFLTFGGPALAVCGEWMWIGFGGELVPPYNFGIPATAFRPNFVIRVLYQRDQRH